MEQNELSEPILLKDERKRFSKVGLACFVYVAVASIIQLAGAYGIAAFCPDFLQSDWYVFLILTIPQYVFALPLCAVVMRGIPRQTIFAESKMTVGRFLKLFLICVGVMYIGNLLGSGLMNLVGALRGREVVNVVEAVVTTTSPLMSAVMTVLLAPLVEEFIFRKLVMDRLVRYGEAAAIIASAIIFGLIHGNFYQFFYAFGLGAVFAYVYAKTGKLRHTVLLHALINTVGGVIAPAIAANVDYDILNEISLGNITEMSDEVMRTVEGAMWLSVYSFAMFAVALAGIILLIANRKKIKFRKGECIIPKGARFKTMYLNVGMILLFIASAALFVIAQLA